MTKYPSILNVYKRDPDTHKVIEGCFFMPEFEYLQDNTWVGTEKIDGTNIRVMWNGENVEFRGRTDKAQMPGPLGEKLAQMFSSTELFEVFGAEGDICLYGEGYGAGINKGGKYIPDGCSFILFDVKIGTWWLEHQNIRDIARQLNIAVVPIVITGTLLDMVGMVKSGITSGWGDFPAEGIVAKPSVELVARNGARIITKIKHEDFARGAD